MDGYAQVMNYGTHRYLGTLLFPELRDRWNIELNEEAFLYGCVKPDITTLFVRHPHFWKISKKFIFKRINTMCRRAPKPGKAHKGFSEELGVILHYIADFFTAVHNLSPNPIREHIEFERALHRAFLEKIDQDTVAGYFNFRDRLETLGSEEREGDENRRPGGIADPGIGPDIPLTRSNRIAKRLISEIGRRHGEYRPDRTDPEKDPHGIVGASVLAAAAVMDAVTFNCGLNSGAASPRPGLLPETLQDRNLRASVPDIADFR